MNITISKKAAKTLETFDKSLQTRILDGINGIPKGDIKPLYGYSDGRQRLRIGKYRIVFYYMAEGLYVMEIGSRGDIYK